MSDSAAFPGDSHENHKLFTFVLRTSCGKFEFLIDVLWGICLA